MRIAITGASGFVGRAVAAALAASGNDVVRLVRPSAGGQGPGTAAWDPATGAVDLQALGACDAVVHLAGENVAAGRWTAARRQAIADSRGPATERLCHTLVAARHRPRVLVSASATGIYGDRGDTLLDESSPPGRGFLADVARAWEAGTSLARQAGIRVATLRIGMVLDPAGGALARMRTPFRLGLGGRLGSGRQWMSWITRNDLVEVIRFALQRDDLAGPILAVAPEPVTNREFTQSLAATLRRPALLPVPPAALRLLFGSMADELLLASQRAIPTRLMAAGFRFTAPRLQPALAALLGR